MQQHHRFALPARMPISKTRILHVDEALRYRHLCGLRHDIDRFCDSVTRSGSGDIRSGDRARQQQTSTKDGATV
jgi:hypothetical protein